MQTTVVDGYRFFGGQVSEPETYRLVRKHNFCQLHLHLAPPFWVVWSEFYGDILHHKTRVHDRYFCCC